MSAYLAYLLGLLTMLIIFVPFWVLSLRFQGVANAYRSIFCSEVLA